MSKSNQKSANVPSGAVLCDVTTDKKAAKALANATTKHAHVEPGNIWRHADGKHLVVLILCTHPGCTKERAVFTSDVFQTKFCVDHRAEARIAFRKSEKAPKAEKAVGKRVSSKDASKGTRKGKKAEKATRKAPKGKGKSAKSDTTTTTAEVK